jgi:two-component system osmolarity sensor histidine kinase EnvZ
VSLLPRSLLWRTVVLMALVLAASQLASLEMVRRFEREPRARQIAAAVASVANLTRSALTSAEPSKRRELLAELAEREGIRVHPGNAFNPPPPRFPRPGLDIIADELKRELGPETRVAWRPGNGGTLWVSVPIEGQVYWLEMPRARLERPFPWGWFAWGAVLLAFAVAGAYLVVRRVNQPLKALAEAAESIGRGETPPRIEEAGPTEIRGVARSFNAMSDGLKRLESDRALLLAGVSHDLRTPLARLRLGVELTPDADPKLKSEMCSDIEAMDAIIGQFLDFVKLDAAESPRPDADLNALLQKAVDDSARDGEAPTLSLSPLPPMPLRAVAIQRLVSNLLANARRHGRPPVELRTRRERGSAVLSVLDRGPGIPASEAARMLQPLTRLDSARGSGGSGLGLAIADRVARLHGGRVELLPREGGGLEARVTLPLAGHQGSK